MTPERGLTKIARVDMCDADELTLSAGHGLMDFATNIPCEFFARRAPAGEARERVLKELTNIFRPVGDDARFLENQMERAFKALYPRYQPVDWRECPARQNMFIKVKNPTQKPVAFSMYLRLVSIY